MGEWQRGEKRTRRHQWGGLEPLADILTVSFRYIYHGLTPLQIVASSFNKKSSHLYPTSTDLQYHQDGDH